MAFSWKNLAERIDPRNWLMPHWPAARDYAVSDLATLTNAVPFDGGKYDELFQRAL